MPVSHPAPLPQSIQSRIDEHQQEMGKVLQHNAVLQQENEGLRQQVESTQLQLDDLRTNQQDKLNALAEQIKKQVSIHTFLTEKHHVVNSLYLGMCIMSHVTCA
jgi:regulator of replication initiation timing